MKVVAFNGSPRKDGNTTILIRQVFKELENRGIVTELVQLSEMPVQGCIACYRCAKAKDRRCAVQTDAANAHIEKMLAADGIILASPVYFQGITPDMKALIDRAGFVSRSNDRMFRNKVGASLVALRRSGGTTSLDTMNHFFLAGEMIIVGRATGIGMERGAVLNDEEGMTMATSLGRRMAWLLEKLPG